MSWQMRTESLLGTENIARLSRARVAVVGLGGVGSYAAEALVRAGIGELLFIDGDTFTESNINRQLGASVKTVGLSKAEVTAARAREINPDARVTAITAYYTAESAEDFDFSRCDFLIDAIDMVSAKVDLICSAVRLNVPAVSAMGAGNKLDASAFRVSDIYKTEGCALSRVMRRELRARGIARLPVVWSPEPPRIAVTDEQIKGGARAAPGSVSYVPPVVGMLCAGYVIRTLCGL